MKKLNIERLKDFERNPSNNFLTRSEMMEAIKELIAIRELKGDQVPVAAGTTEECSPDVYAKGISACLVDIPKEKAEVICRGISAASGVAVDWHYVGGRVHIKAMRVTAPQKPVLHPDTKRMDWLCAHAVEVRDPQMYGSHAMFHAQQDSEEWDLPHHTTLREQVDAAIEAAGGIVFTSDERLMQDMSGIVKDGE